MPFWQPGKRDNRSNTRYSRSQRRPSQRYSQRPTGYILWIILALLVGFGLGLAFSQLVLAPSESIAPTTIVSEPTVEYRQSVSTPTANSSPIPIVVPTRSSITESTPQTPEVSLSTPQFLAETPVPISTATPTAPSLDLETLQELMLNLINADRASEDLNPVVWDNFAAQVAQAHAEDMATNGYMSHWDLSGEGPDIRYGLSGGTEAVQENVYMYWHRYEDGRPAPIEDWKKVVKEAQASLMNSPGHRANIMASEHTHVGIGIAYNTETGDVRIAQEFINRYVSLEPMPERVKLGDTIIVSGELLRETSNPIINLAYEPFPTPVTVEWLDDTNTYTSPAVFFEAINPTVNADGYFSARVTLDAEGQSGIYHIRIWVDVGDHAVNATDAIVEVKQ